MDHDLTILIVDDEKHIADLLVTNLTLDGYQTLWTAFGEQALKLIRARRVDLILLDVMLPDCVGVDLCRRIKQIRQDIPILMMSALGQSKDRIAGLKSGADDYLPKPFDLEELMLRISNLIKRRPSKEVVKDIVAMGKATVNFQLLEIDGIQGKSTLSKKEALLLKYMYENPNVALSRSSILDKVWGYEEYPNTRTIDNFISNIRKHIELDANHPQYIITVRGVGYLYSEES